MRLHVRLALPLFAAALAVTVAGTLGTARLLGATFGFALDAQGRQLAAITDSLLRGRSRGLTDTAVAIAGAGEFVAQAKAREKELHLDLAGWHDEAGKYRRGVGPSPNHADLKGLAILAPTATISLGSGAMLIRAGDRLMVVGIVPGPVPWSFGVVGHRLGKAWLNALAELLVADVTLVAGGRTVATTFKPGADPRDFHPVELTLSTTGQWPLTFTFFVPARPAVVARRRALAATVAGGAVLLLAALAFYGWTVFRITRPIRDMAEAAQRIAAGHLDERLPADAPAELGLLVRQFNAMGAALKAAQEKLVHSAKLSSVGSMVAGISHELNNPLWGLLGNAEVLDGLVPAGAPGREELDAVLREGRRMKKALADLRGFVRPAVSERTRLDLNDVAAEVLALVRHEAEKSKVACRTILDPGGAPVVASGDEIRQVALNLALNSLQAMPQGGELVFTTVVAEQGGQRVARLVVADSGSGIPADILPKLTEPFFTTKPGHMGLGLAISHEIAAKHGGKLALANRDGGAVATLDLPAAPPEAPGTPKGSP
jgi:signal transduction histidine kinase